MSKDEQIPFAPSVTGRRVPAPELQSIQRDTYVPAEPEYGHAMFVQCNKGPLPKPSAAAIARMENVIGNLMANHQGVTSRSGWTAAMAVNWCERAGVPYVLESYGGWLGYHVRRTDEPRAADAL